LFEESKVVVFHSTDSLPTVTRTDLRLGLHNDRVELSALQLVEKGVDRGCAEIRQAAVSSSAEKFAHYLFNVGFSGWKKFLRRGKAKKCISK
jgi:hypothetical protein